MSGQEEILDKLAVLLGKKEGKPPEQVLAGRNRVVVIGVKDAVRDYVMRALSEIFPQRMESGSVGEAGVSDDDDGAMEYEYSYPPFAFKIEKIPPEDVIEELRRGFMAMTTCLVLIDSEVNGENPDILSAMRNTESALCRVPVLSVGSGLTGSDLTTDENLDGVVNIHTTDVESIRTAIGQAVTSRTEKEIALRSEALRAFVDFAGPRVERMITLAKRIGKIDFTDKDLNGDVNNSLLLGEILDAKQKLQYPIRRLDGYVKDLSRIINEGEEGTLGWPGSLSDIGDGAAGGTSPITVFAVPGEIHHYFNNHLIISDWEFLKDSLDFTSIALPYVQEALGLGCELVEVVNAMIDSVEGRYSWGRVLTKINKILDRVI